MLSPLGDKVFAFHHWTSNSSPELHVYNALTGDRLCENNQVHDIKAGTWTLDGSQIVIVMEDGSDAFEYEYLYHVDPHTCELSNGFEFPDEKHVHQTSFIDERTLVIRASNRRATGGGRDSYIEIWDMVSMTMMERIGSGKDRLTSVKAAPGGQHIGAVYGRGGDTRLEDTDLVILDVSNVRVSAEAVPMQAEVQVYPNPTTDYVQFTQSGIVTFYDLLGRERGFAHVRSNEPVSVTNLPNGVYLYTFSSRHQVASGKLVRR